MWPGNLIGQGQFRQKMIFSTLFLVLFESVSIFGAELDTFPEIAINVTEKDGERGGNSTGADQEINYPVPKSTVIVSAVGSFIIVILIIALVLCGRRNRKLRQLVRHLSDEELDQFYNGNKTGDPSDANAKIYPPEYDQSLEISPDSIEIDESSVLGGGRFGIIRPGFLKTKSHENGFHRGIRVAVKIPKFNLTTEHFISFLHEIQTMSFVQNHENVLKIHGASTLNIKKHQALIALEFCELGNLKHFLRDKRHQFRNEFTGSSLTESEQEDFPGAGNGYGDPWILLPESERLKTTDLLNFAFGVANGMRFLEEKRVIHGDLAARNILLAGDREVKISDFASSIRLPRNELYTKMNSNTIPWRWYPLEALEDQQLWLGSDCWSFGILLYEIFSLGEDPYPSFDQLELNFMQSLRDGYRNEKPEFANEDIYELMQRCWKAQVNERPTFARICETILDISSEIVGPKLNLM